MVVMIEIEMNENIPNIYEAEFLPPIIGNYTGKIASASLNLFTYFDINVTAGSTIDLSEVNESISKIKTNTDLIPATL